MKHLLIVKLFTIFLDWTQCFFYITLHNNCWYNWTLFGIHKKYCCCKITKIAAHSVYQRAIIFLCSNLQGCLGRCCLLQIWTSQLFSSDLLTFSVQLITSYRQTILNFAVTDIFLFLFSHIKIFLFLDEIFLF